MNSLPQTMKAVALTGHGNGERVIIDFSIYNGDGESLADIDYIGHGQGINRAMSSTHRSLEAETTQNFRNQYCPPVYV